MKPWLCIGEKKKEKSKCIHATVQIKTFIGDWGNQVQKLVVYCNLKDRYVSNWVSRCENFANQTLFESFDNGN